ncbi:hypothetical protein Pyn_12550 [Prunus yedoensis var. nudiflora]|uniref:Uncharacterized protein n=1 Tax=Prunus yedoensis var. nudiflora TaxID=2094558 RepID=A0A314XIQ3_PRUYE|nr:hypothetical protein Pyn_12550 [Prunus yedoensis var. nudiflora]
MSEERHQHGLFHHKKDEDRPIEAAYGVNATHESEIDYKKEEKHHKNLEHLGEGGVAGAGVFALYLCSVIVLKSQGSQPEIFLHFQGISQ